MPNSVSDDPASDQAWLTAAPQLGGPGVGRVVGRCLGEGVGGGLGGGVGGMNSIVSSSCPF